MPHAGLSRRAARPAASLTDASLGRGDGSSLGYRLCHGAWGLHKGLRGGTEYLVKLRYLLCDLTLSRRPCRSRRLLV